MAPVTDALTPSEIVFVHGEQFAKARKDGVKLPRGGERVDAEALAASMLTAALLANESAGALRLEVGIEKHLFGLVKKRAVHVVATGPDPRWPAGTLEARLHAFVSARPRKGEWTAREVVRGLFPDDDPNPYVEVAIWVRDALLARELADEAVEEKKSLGIFKLRYSHAVLNPAGIAAADSQPLAPVQEMVAAVARQRAELADRMGKEIRSALSSRVESDSGDPD